MKIRNGFVSNSSSSSFVVAFPSEPKNYDNVFEMMFHGKEGGISIYDTEGMSHSQIADRVWRDIENGTDDKYYGYSKTIPAKKDDIIEEFSGRYYYSPADSNMSWFGQKGDELGGSWMEPIDKYCGNDKTSMDELRNFTISSNTKEKELYQKMNDIIKNEFKLKQPKFAYKNGKDRKTGDPYTDEEIKTYDDYLAALLKFRNEHEEYKAVRDEELSTSQNKWKEKERLARQIAKVDAEVFLEDNKEAYIVILSYADDGGECTLEHGDIFRNVPHIQISHH
jgi:hypothetical protein